MTVSNLKTSHFIGYYRNKEFYSCDVFELRHLCEKRNGCRELKRKKEEQRIYLEDLLQQIRTVQSQIWVTYGNVQRGAFTESQFALFDYELK